MLMSQRPAKTFSLGRMPRWARFGVGSSPGLEPTVWNRHILQNQGAGLDRLFQICLNARMHSIHPEATISGGGEYNDEGSIRMQRTDYPVTPAIRVLRDRRVGFEPRQYPFVEHGGTKHASAMLGVPEHAVIKTLVMETESRQAFLVLMHGDMDVSTKHLARILGVKRVSPCDVPTAQKLTGYLVGGISPFGTRKELPVYAEKTVLSLERIYINGGKRGFLVEMDPRDIREILDVTEVEVGIR